MGAVLDFYDIVSILPCDAVPKRLWGTQGVVVGRAQSSNGLWEYAIQAFADEDCCWQIDEQFLRAEGRRMNRDELYTGESVRVRLDPVANERSTKN